MKARYFVPVFALAVSAAAFAADEGYFDLKASPESQVQAYVDAEGGEKLKGVRKVLIPQFRIEYMLRAESSSSSAAGNSNSGYVHLKGIDDAALQQLTDKVYGQFVKDLAAKGITVIGIDQLQSVPEYEPIGRIGKPSGETLETKDSISKFFAPTGGRVYSLLRRTDKERQGAGSGFATAWADVKKELPKAELDLAKKFDAPCLKVLLTVVPARVKPGASVAGGLVGAVVGVVSSAEVKPGLTIAEESRMVFRSSAHSENDFKVFGGSKFFGSKVRDFTEEGDSAVFLKKDVRVGEAISDKPMEETTSGYRKVSNVLAPVMALALGASNKHVEYTIEANPELFDKVALEEAVNANRMLITRFGELVEGRGVKPEGQENAAAQ